MGCYGWNVCGDQNMKADIRLSTCLVIKKDGQFLQGNQMGTGILVWTNSPYDAWKTRCRGDAERVAFLVKGEILLFNPVIGKIRKAKWRDA